jgi:DNA helicase HerA-like ATPase
LPTSKGIFPDLGAPGTLSEKAAKTPREMLGLRDWQPQAAPVVFWDVFGKQGHPVRATVSDMGPLLFSRLLGLNETQEGVLSIVFRIADDNGLLLIDLKDLRAMVQYVGEHAADFKTQYGNISAASIGAIQRGLLTLEAQGGDQFFGEQMLDIADLMQTLDGRGVVNILAADPLMQAPKVYATFLLWLLAELFERLPEVGDLEKPKLVFFFDEAHLLFDEAPAALIDKVEQVVRLIRSKGVGVYFVTQNPLDIPEKVLGQLGNRVQHALRAFTPRDQKAVQTAAQTLRQNPKFSAAQAITELGVGEALVSFLDEKGTPNIVERAWVLPPSLPYRPIDQRRAHAADPHSSLLYGHYEKVVDRESAYEMLQARAASPDDKVGAGGTAPQQEASGGAGFLSEILFGRTGPRGGQTDGLVQAAAKSITRTIASQVGREIVRGVLGSLLGGSRRR